MQPCGCLSSLLVHKSVRHGPQSALVRFPGLDESAVFESEAERMSANELRMRCEKPKCNGIERLDAIPVSGRVDGIWLPEVDAVDEMFGAWN